MIIAATASALAQTPSERGLQYLAREVPKWRAENGCFSCHNNGDGARALYAAKKHMQALASTNEWLVRPAEWDKGRSDATNSDKRLARMQFAAALTSAIEAGAVTDRQALNTAAESLIALQSSDGSWEIEDEGEAAGSPVTWGTTLSTYFVRRTLQTADVARFGTAIARAEQWLRSTQPRYTPDAAAVLLAFPQDAGVRARSIERFALTQTSDGGWGPIRNAPAEAFDTALVLLALSAADPGSKLIAGGREFLVRTQQASGGWPETTRPPGSQSYAQHISTTAWATMALLATDPQRT